MKYLLTTSNNADSGFEIENLKVNLLILYCAFINFMQYFINL